MRRSLLFALLFRLSERYCLSLPGVQFGNLHYSNLRRDKFLAVAHNTGVYDALVSLFCSARALSYKCGLRMPPGVSLHWSSTIGLYFFKLMRVVAGALPVQLMFLAVLGAGIAAQLF